MLERIKSVGCERGISNRGVPVPVDVLVLRLESRLASAENDVPHASLFPVVPRLLPALSMVQVVVLQAKFHAERA